MRSITWDGDRPISAGWRYSSGAGHFSYDVPMPSGTRLYSPVDGFVINRVTGVPNRPGGPGSPSNWVHIGHTDSQGRKRSHYLQHMSKVVVSPGQKLTAGQLVGYSGNSGYSSGPHLHWNYQDGHPANRYTYLNNGGATAVYPPTKGEDQKMPTAKEIADEVWSRKIDLNPGGKAEMVPAWKALRIAAVQSRKAADQPAPSAARIWDEIIDEENGKTARQALRGLWRKVLG